MATQQALDALERDFVRLGIMLSPQDWRGICGRLTDLSFPSGQTIQNQAHVANAWVFLVSGIAASEQTWDDGTTTIARFFLAGDFCANMTSAWTGDIASDDLIAITDVTGLSLPDSLFRPEYLSGGAFGTYLRIKAMETHLFDKELICAKTVGRSEIRYRFLEHYQADVIARARQQDIARFMGVTPQGLSRFLRRRNRPTD
ncbi:MAG: cyclic nucleotide-binding domain-containing protein [Pseudomonadota bacterium]